MYTYRDNALAICGPLPALRTSSTRPHSPLFPHDHNILTQEKDTSSRPLVWARLYYSGLQVVQTERYECETTEEGARVGREMG
jgi:hypothetical protein